MEAALEKFLTEERGLTFLQVPINRIMASANEILSSLNKRENALEMDSDKFRAKYVKSVAEIDSLRKKSYREMKNIDAAAIETKRKVRPIVERFSQVLRQAAIEAIDKQVILPRQLEDKKAVGDKLGQKIAESIHKTAQKQSDKIQKEIEIGLIEEVSRLENFTNDVVGTLQKNEMDFNSIDASSQANTNAGIEGITAALAIYTGFGGIWSGYKEAGAKGAAVGAVSSFGAVTGVRFVAMRVLPGIIGLSAAFPATVALTVATGVLSFFAGGKLVKTVFGAEQVENFKKNYQEAALKEIDSKLAQAGIEQKIDTSLTILSLA